MTKRKRFCVNCPLADDRTGGRQPAGRGESGYKAFTVQICH